MYSYRIYLVDRNAVREQLVTGKHQLLIIVFARINNKVLFLLLIKCLQVLKISMCYKDITTVIMR